MLEAVLADAVLHKERWCFWISHLIRRQANCSHQGTKAAQIDLDETLHQIGVQPPPLRPSHQILRSHFQSFAHRNLRKLCSFIFYFTFLLR